MLVGICDDDRIFVEKFLMQLENILKNICPEYHVIIFHDSTSVINYCMNEDYSTKIDLLFLNVEMPVIDGIVLKKKIDKYSKIKYIIFISEYVNRISETYGKKSIGYLLKPIQIFKLEERIRYFVDKIVKNQKITFIDIVNKRHSIYIDELNYARAEKKYTSIHLIDSTSFFLPFSITKTENFLKKYSFIRCHRSFIISTLHLKYISKGNAILDNGNKIPIGRIYYRSVQQAKLDNLINNHRKID